ncbi:O-antigen ligase family protein [Microbacterium betulae]|uniref:O-antigen ligase family protein n=1 Tax=Microbacterium betulae TaxID=2981139 RepID=A0AA97FHD1_9MICO|nr:O-antigen ligase family protein [Microbacterium sp. AB]WOF22325.1 O-antigen ligase family protein [Microbacterium sp. AB]
MILVAEPSFLDSRTPLEIVLILAAALVGAAFVVFLSFRLPARTLLGVAFVLGVLQFFGPFGFTSLGLLAIAALLPGAAWRFGRDGANLWLWLLIVLAVWQTVSVLWADKLGSAAYGVLLTEALVAVFLIARETIRESPQGLVSALRIASPFVLLQALLVSLFRFFPDLEYAYLTSPIARILTEPGVELIADGSTENVNDVFKAGGLFLNANTASLFLAVVACLYAWAALQRPGRRTFWLFLAVVAVSLDATLGTGSKTPIVAMVALPLLAVFALVAVRRPLVALVVGVAGAAAAVGGIALIAAVRPRLLDETIRTLDERRRLWDVVLAQVPEHWFTGLGFGNWRLTIAEEWRMTFPGRGLQLFPPHNLFSQAWADAGLVALLLTVALSLGPIVAVLRRIWRHRDDRLLSRGSLELLVVFVGVSWVLTHGMLDTTTFLGDNHLVPFFGAIVAVAFSERLGRRQDERVDSPPAVVSQAA